MLLHRRRHNLRIPVQLHRRRHDLPPEVVVTRFTPPPQHQSHRMIFPPPPSPRNLQHGSRRALQAVENMNLSFSSGSIEAPKGCLSYFISHCSQAKTSRSARVSRLPRSKPFRFIKENLVSKKLHRVKKSNTSILASEVLPFIPMDSTKTPPLQASFSPEIQSTAKSPACYTAGHLISSSGNNTETPPPPPPPLQPSVSPEIKSTTTMAATPACYTAGHLLSGVTDKRKCRARGVLAVAQSGSTLTDNSHNVGLEKDCKAGLDNKLSVTMLPSPTEASMHWLLSPCRENDNDDNESSASLHSLLEKHKTCLSPLSPLSDLGFSLELCNLSNDTSLDCLSTPSNSTDLSQLQKVLDDGYLWTSNPTFKNVSQSEMRISWREGLASRIFEMDEFDSCRCLSDEEEDLNGCSFSSNFFNLPV